MRFIHIKILGILSSILCVATMVITSTKEVPCEILPNGVIAIIGEGPNGKIKRSEEARVINRTMCTIPVYSPVVRIAQKTLDQVFEESNIPVPNKNDTVGKNQSLCNGVMLDLDMCLSSQQVSVLEADAPSNIGLGERKGQRLIRKKRKIVSDVTARWPDNTIPYEIHESDFSIMELKTIIDALTEYEMKTCIIFKPAIPEDKNKLVIMGGRGCYSNIGMIGGTQRLVLDKGNCRKKRVIMHELGHAIGMVHEHQRYDRDNYITIVRENVRPAVLDQFKKFSRNVVDIGSVPYDYLSIMHYGKSFFSSDGFSTTIRTNNPNYQDLIGRTEQLSFIDVKAVNLMYRCNARCPDAKTMRCPSDGYQDKFCICRCSDSSKCVRSARHEHSYGIPLAIASKNGPYYKIQSPIRSNIIQRAPLTREQMEALNEPQNLHQQAFIHHPDFHQIVHQPSFLQPSFGHILSPFPEPFFQPQPFDIPNSQQPFYEVSNSKTVNGVPLQSPVGQDSVTPQPDPQSSTQNIINGANLNPNNNVQNSSNQETVATSKNIDINDQLFTTDSASQQDMLAHLMTSGIGFEVVVGPQDNMTPHDLVLDLSQISSDQQLLILQQLQLQPNDTTPIDSSTRATSTPEPLTSTMQTKAALNEPNLVSNYSKPELQLSIKSALEQISVTQQQEKEHQMQQLKLQRNQQNQKDVLKQLQSLQPLSTVQRTHQLKQQKRVLEKTIDVQEVIGKPTKEPQQHNLQNSHYQPDEITTGSTIQVDNLQQIPSNDIKNQQKKLHKENTQIHIDVLLQQQVTIKDKTRVQSTPSPMRQQTVKVPTNFQTQPLPKQKQQKQHQQSITLPRAATVLEQSKTQNLQPILQMQQKRQTISTTQPTLVLEKKSQKDMKQQIQLKALQWKSPSKQETYFTKSTKILKPLSIRQQVPQPFLQSKNQTKTPNIQPIFASAQAPKAKLQKPMEKQEEQQQQMTKAMQLEHNTLTIQSTKFQKSPSIDSREEKQLSNNNTGQSGRQQPVTQPSQITKQLDNRSQRNNELRKSIGEHEQVQQLKIQLRKQLPIQSHETQNHRRQTTPMMPRRSQRTQEYQVGKGQINRQQRRHQQKLQEYVLSDNKKKQFQQGLHEAKQVVSQQQIQRQNRTQNPQLQQQQQHIKQKQSVLKRLSESKKMQMQKRPQARRQFLPEQREQQSKQLQQQQPVQQQEQPSEIRLSKSKNISMQYKQQFLQKQKQKYKHHSVIKLLPTRKNITMQPRQQSKQQFLLQQQRKLQPQRKQLQQSVLNRLSGRKNIPTQKRQQSRQQLLQSQQSQRTKAESSPKTTRRPIEQPAQQLLKSNFIQKGTLQQKKQKQSEQLLFQQQQKQFRLQTKKKQMELLQKKQLLQAKLRRQKIARQSKLFQLSQENKLKGRSSVPYIQYPKNIRKTNADATTKQKPHVETGIKQNRLQITEPKSNRNQHNIQITRKQSPKTNLVLGQGNIRNAIKFRQHNIPFLKQNAVNRRFKLKTKLPSPIITLNSKNGKHTKIGRVLSQRNIAPTPTKQKNRRQLQNNGNDSYRRKQQVNTRPQLKKLDENNKPKQTNTLQNNQRIVSPRPINSRRNQVPRTNVGAIKAARKIQSGRMVTLQQQKANLNPQIQSNQRLSKVDNSKSLVRLNSRNPQRQRLLKTSITSNYHNSVGQKGNRKIGILRVVKPLQNSKIINGQSRRTWTKRIQQPQRGLWGSLPFYAVGRYPSDSKSTMATDVPEVQIYPSGNKANDIAAVNMGKSTTTEPKTPQPPIPKFV